jgi:hypothetical protein
MTVKRISNL